MSCMLKLFLTISLSTSCNWPMTEKKNSWINPVGKEKLNDLGRSIPARNVKLAQVSSDSPK